MESTHENIFYQGNTIIAVNAPDTAKALKILVGNNQFGQIQILIRDIG